MNFESLWPAVASSSDALEITDLSTRCFIDTYAVHNTPENIYLFLTGPFHPEKLMAELIDPTLRFLVMRGESGIAAYAILQKSPAPGLEMDPNTWEIRRFYVDVPFKGRGIGRRLMTFCLEYLQSLRASNVWLGVWKRNDAAILFYRKMGYHHAGEHVFLLGNDTQLDLIMMRAIPAPGVPIFEPNNHS